MATKSSTKRWHMMKHLGLLGEQHWADKYKQRLQIVNKTYQLGILLASHNTYVIFSTFFCLKKLTKIILVISTFVVLFSNFDDTKRFCTIYNKVEFPFCRVLNVWSSPVKKWSATPFQFSSHLRSYHVKLKFAIHKVFNSTQPDVHLSTSEK